MGDDDEDDLVHGHDDSIDDKCMHLKRVQILQFDSLPKLNSVFSNMTFKEQRQNFGKLHLLNKI